MRRFDPRDEVYLREGPLSGKRAMVEDSGEREQLFSLRSESKTGSAVTTHLLVRYARTSHSIGGARVYGYQGAVRLW